MSVYPTVKDQWSCSIFNTARAYINALVYLIFLCLPNHIALSSPKIKKHWRARITRLEHHGLLLFSCWSDPEGEKKQAGSRNLFKVWWWSKCSWYENLYKILPCAILLEILESYHVYFLWSCTQILPLNYFVLEDF